jgi:hypothetical protein
MNRFSDYWFTRKRIGWKRKNSGFGFHYFIV